MITKSPEESIAIFNLLDVFLQKRGIVCADSPILRYVEERNSGMVFDLPRHIKGIVYSQLSSQQKWAVVVEPKLAHIDTLFFNYDISLIKKHDGNYFNKGIRALNCGNRSINGWTANLHYNISVLEKIEKAEGGIDKYYLSMPAHKLVKILSSSGKYKLKYVGLALAWEYLGNVGIDRIKPDVHTRRILGSNRLGYSKKQMATEDEVVTIAQNISNQTGLSLSMIDALLWNMCVAGKVEVCTEKPNCSICPIASYCSRLMN